MADFKISLAKTLTAEGGYFWNKTTGEIVNRGVTAQSLIDFNLLPPDLASMPAAYAAYLANKSPATESAVQPLATFIENYSSSDTTLFYMRHYWIPMHGDSILAQPIADKLFDVEVNQGGVAIPEMQNAINDLQMGGQAVQVDGVMGPKTLGAINSLPVSKLLPSFQARVESRYRKIAANNPALAGDLGAKDPPSGWLGRLYS